MRPSRWPFTWTGALGRLFCFWLLALAAPLGADPCAAPPHAVAAEVRRVVDGDTLLLATGERLRMVGLDAPELGRGGNADEPFAREAARHLDTLVRLSGNRVSLVTGAQDRDRYGRLLAVVYTGRHGDLAGQLIRQGLALAAPVPPNLGGLECHRAAEAEARAARAGLWGMEPGPVVPATALDRTGFAILAGRAGEWTRRRGDRLLTLDGAVTLRFREADIERWFDADALESLAGRRVEVRGWVHPWDRGGRAITVQHPVTIEVIE